jgi:hypothetical protein
MTTREVLRQRLHNQKLLGELPSQPVDAVRWLGAMQAQEYAMAKWAIGLRTQNATNDSVEAALDQGLIVRTHVLRPTWHFVAAEDLRWMLALTAPHVRSAMAYMDRKLEIDRKFLKRCHAVITRELRGGSAATRPELAAILAKTKLPVLGPRLAHIFIHAELDGLICSGPRVEGKSTYQLIEERVPEGKSLSRERALAELARRYFSSRGPATAQDFAWWSGLTLREANVGIEDLTRGFDHVTIGKRIYVLPTADLPPKSLLEQANFYLPDYDEYGIAYKDRGALFDSSTNADQSESVDSLVAFNRMFVVGGKMVGSWRREEKKDHLTLERKFFAPGNRVREKRLAEAAERYARFVGKPVRLLD